jgi:hypothetical protein
MSIFAKLGIVMTVDSAQLQKGLSDATISSRAFQNELKKQQKESAQFAQAAGAALSKVAVVAAVAGAAILKAFSYADQIQDTADSIDITVESLIQFQKALMLSGGDAEKLGGLFTKLQVAQDKAREGADDVRDAFKRLGVSAGEVDQLKTDELFKRVAQELAKIEDPATRNAQAFALLGKAAKGVDWAEYWNNYGKGKAVSKNVAEAIEAGATAWDNLKIAGSAALNAILVLAKPVADLINRLAEIVKNNENRKDTFTDNFNEAKKRLETNKEYLDSGLAKRREMIEALAIQIQQEKELQAIQDKNKAEKKTKLSAVTTYKKDSDKDKTLAERQRVDRAGIMEDFNLAVKELHTVEQKIDRETELMGLSEKAQEFKKLEWALQDQNTKMQLALDKEIALEKAKTIDQDKIKILLLQSQKELFAEQIALEEDAAKKRIDQKEQEIRTKQLLTNQEKEGFQTAIDNMQVLAQKNKAAFIAWKAMAVAMAIIDTYKGATSAYASMAGIPVVGPALGYTAAALAIAAGMMRVATISSTQYQGRAKGGSIVANTPYMVGEQGPELIIPNRGATVVPNNQLSNHLGGREQNVFNGPFIANMSAIDTQSAFQFLSKNKDAVYAANQSATRSLPASR